MSDEVEVGRWIGKEEVRSLKKKGERERRVSVRVKRERGKEE